VVPRLATEQADPGVASRRRSVKAVRNASATRFGEGSSRLVIAGSSR
jgi:hypothetical protein